MKSNFPDGKAAAGFGGDFEAAARALPAIPGAIVKGDTVLMMLDAEDGSGANAPDDTAGATDSAEVVVCATDRTGAEVTVLPKDIGAGNEGGAEEAGTLNASVTAGGWDFTSGWTISVEGLAVLPAVDTGRGRIGEILLEASVAGMPNLI